MTAAIKHYEDLFYDLHTGVVGDHERPHKPAMMLAVMDLIETGKIDNNLIPFSTALRERFTYYYDIVKSENDRNTPLNPYFYMRSEEFWSHVPTTGNDAAVKALSAPPAIRDIPSLIKGAALAPQLWNALNNPQHRSRLRDLLVSRYFPQHRDALLGHQGGYGGIPTIGKIVRFSAHRGASLRTSMRRLWA